MSVLDKFTLKPEHKDGFKKALADMIDKQFDGFQDSYLAAFKGLPYEVLEGMTEKQAADFVGLVVSEAAANVKAGFEALGKEMRKIADDPARMDEVRRKFMESAGGGQMEADIPDVPKNTMEANYHG